MNYAGLIENDFTGISGIQLTLFVQGCPAPHCENCHNPETWGFCGGKEFTQQTLETIIQGLTANGIQRSFALQGGEPLCEENEFLSHMIILEIKKRLPETKIYVWSRYTYEELQKRSSNHIRQILELADYLIDGPYIDSLRDITLPLRGSSNQRIINLKTGEAIR